MKTKDLRADAVPYGATWKYIFRIDLWDWIGGTKMFWWWKASISLDEKFFGDKLFEWTRQLSHTEAHKSHMHPHKVYEQRLKVMGNSSRGDTVPLWLRQAALSVK